MSGAEYQRWEEIVGLILQRHSVAGTPGSGKATHREREGFPTGDKSHFCLHFAEKSVRL